MSTTDPVALVRRLVTALEDAIRRPMGVVPDSAMGLQAEAEAWLSLFTTGAPACFVGSKPIEILYTNWRGETRPRRILPTHLWWGATEWHPEPQWMLNAVDLEKVEPRDFAIRDMQMRPEDADALALAGLMAARDQPAVSPAGIRLLADWFDNPNHSPELVVTSLGGTGHYTPGYLLRRIADALDQVGARERGSIAVG